MLMNLFRDLINRLIVFLRRLRYYIFKYSGLSFKQNNEMNVYCILLYPKITKENQLRQILRKIDWYLPKVENYRFNIKLAISKNVNYDEIENQNNSNISIIFDYNRKIYHESNLVLNWKFSIIELLKFYFKDLRDKILLVDPNFYSTFESLNFERLLFNILDDKTRSKLREISRRNFLQFLNNITNNKSYLFLTGPSIENLFKFQFEDGVRIVCNSIVKNEEYLNYIKPNLITFADPVFHFSYNQYSQTFLEDVINAVENYNSFVVIPEQAFPLIYYHYPKIRNRLIGMPIKHQTEINFPSPSKFYSSGGNSILLIFMLPIASYISDQIYFIGADGREKNEKYFWKHSSDVQYNGLINEVRKSHPSFFRDRMYKDYYTQYCEEMEKIIRFGQEQGKEYQSLTKSLIPILDKLYNVIK